jgi:hypothetical protein
MYFRSKIHPKKNEMYFLFYIIFIKLTIYVFLQLPITTDIVSSNLDQREVYNIMW